MSHPSLLLASQFLDLFIELVPRITLKPLMKYFPCFKTITMSLVEKVRDARQQRRARVYVCYSEGPPLPQDHPPVDETKHCMLEWISSQVH